MRKLAMKLILTLAVFLTAMAAQAQWVAVARAVSGRIQQMQQKSADGKGGYDVATVVIEAPAQKVYETAIQRLQAHSTEVKILKQDSKKREVTFSNGIQNAGLQANPLGEKLTAIGSRFYPGCGAAQRDLAGGEEHPERLRRVESRVHAANGVEWARARLKLCPDVNLPRTEKPGAKARLLAACSHWAKPGASTAVLPPRLSLHAEGPAGSLVFESGPSDEAFQSL